jgi:hypothetical protein
MGYWLLAMGYWLLAMGYGQVSSRALRGVYPERSEGLRAGSARDLLRSLSKDDLHRCG